MPKLVEIPDVGVVEFPDDMSDDDIGSTIEKDILPSYSKTSQDAELGIPSSHSLG